jgi:hypothetical protein
MGVPPAATAVAVVSPADVPRALARWDSALDDVVVRALTPEDTLDETLAVLRAARPG